MEYKNLIWGSVLDGSFQPKGWPCWAEPRLRRGSAQHGHPEGWKLPSRKEHHFRFFFLHNNPQNLVYFKVLRNFLAHLAWLRTPGWDAILSPRQKVWQFLSGVQEKLILLVVSMTSGSHCPHRLRHPPVPEIWILSRTAFCLTSSLMFWLVIWGLTIVFFLDQRLLLVLFC